MKNKWLYRILVYLFFIFIYTVENRYRFLGLNVFLAYIPLEIAFFMKKYQQTLMLWPLLISWFLFYPNAPYMLTDFFHLSAVGMTMSDPNVYFHFVILAIGVVLGLFMGLLSLQIVTKIILTKIGRHHVVIWTGWMLLVSFLTSYAIYLGRFLRLHTIHLITKPIETLGVMLSAFDSDLMYFVLAFTTFHLVMVVVYQLNQNIQKDRLEK
ncbi:DUF1361 domain-containing protein [Isobaculum melis]|uniref:Uncharacterized membrane protein n=1 Tax=Isobaculum melis TaxID=142588 RepID=A0A1H9SGH8_9LACT|nr:DUF1361 domain-containing protein [Isobaculum melis]SER83503.1 Uncharacterized membrane protein [Isobaculum melis]